jgi:hypothetical protein
MIDAQLDVQGSTLQTVQALLRSLLLSGAVDALLVPVSLPSGSVAPMLVKDPDALDQADPLAPVLPINAARAASLLTATNHQHILGLVLRPCEIRALVELVKFQQASLDNALIIGIDCLGTYSVTDYQANDQNRLLDQLLLAPLAASPDPTRASTTAPPARSASSPCPRATTWPSASASSASNPGLSTCEPETTWQSPSASPPATRLPVAPLPHRPTSTPAPKPAMLPLPSSATASTRWTDCSTSSPPASAAITA